MIVIRVSGENGSEVGRERIIDKDNKKRMTNGDDQCDRGSRAECPTRNPVYVRGPLDERADC